MKARSASLPPLAQALLAWGLVGFVLGFVTGARLEGANPSVRAGDALVIAFDLGLAYALGAALVGLLVSALTRLFGGAGSGAAAPFRRALVAAAGGCAVGFGGLALASSLPGKLLAGALALAAATALNTFARRPAALAACLLAGVALAWLGAGFSLVAAAGDEARGEYERFQAPFERPAAPVVLVGIDGADWPRIDALIAQGRLPTFARLLAAGVRAPLATTLPTWSPILWTSISTGTVASEHGVLDFTETPLPGLACGVQRLRKTPLVPSFSGLRTLVAPLYELGWLKEQPISSRHRRVKALWNVVSDVGGRVAVVNWFATWPCEPVNGFMVSDRNPKRAAFLLDRQHLDYESTWGVTYPPELLEALLAVEAHELAPEPEAALALPIFDQVPPERRAALAQEANLLGVFRQIYESDAFALAAACELLRTERLDFAAVYTSGVDNVSHRFTHEGVVDRYYDYIDGLLGQLVAAAGPGANLIIVSDHGFEYDDPERFAHEHGPDGILLMSGPAFRTNARLERTPSILDLAPTVLALLGLPLAENLDGAPVLEAFAPGLLAARPLATVASYGAYAPPLTAAQPQTPDSLQEGVMDKLRTLGYVAE